MEILNRSHSVRLDESKQKTAYPRSQVHRLRRLYPHLPGTGKAGGL